MDKFSIEEIKTAMDKAYPNALNNSFFIGLKENILSELQRPKFQPEVGQVVIHTWLEDDVPTGEPIIYGQHDNKKGIRKQNLTEHGPDVRAYVGGMRRIASDEYISLNGFKDHDAEVAETQDFAAKILKDHSIDD